LNNEIQNNKLILLGKLSASLSHEIRNPLAALKLNLNYLKMMQDDFDKEALESISSSLEAAERIQNLVETTLDFSRKPKKDTGLFSLNNIIEKAVQIMHSNAKRRNIRIELFLQKDMPRINLNKNKILQVILNLLTNAIEASERDGKVNVKSSLATEKNLVLLEVEDFGVGINEDEKEHIFKDFYTNKSNGTGIGLSVCKMLLDEHNSNFYFHSEEGKGTRFFVELPFNTKEI